MARPAKVAPTETSDAGGEKPARVALKRVKIKTFKLVVPGVGRLLGGQIIDLPPAIADQLIAEGHAE